MPAQALILIRFWRRNSSRPLGFILQSYFALFTKVNSLHSVCCSVTPQTQKSLVHPQANHSTHIASKVPVDKFSAPGLVNSAGAWK